MSNVPRPGCTVSLTVGFQNLSLLVSTYMVGDVDHWNESSFGLRRHHIRKVPLIDLHVHIESLTKGGDFHVISVSASAGHLLQVALKDSVYFFSSRGSIIKGCRERSSILPFRVSSYATSRVDIDELLVVFGILTHVPNHARAKLAMLRLVAVDLIRECIK